MSTYQAPVDFRTFDSSDMWLACKGFRSVIHRANYTADVEITALLRGHLQQLLDIDEGIEDREAAKGGEFFDVIDRILHKADRACKEWSQYEYEENKRDRAEDAA